MIMNIIFYKYNGEFNRLNKTLENGVTISGNFNIDYNKINPTIKLVYENDFDFNYCYIQDFSKYYFIDNTVIRRNGFIVCNLSEDTITTYKDLIIKSTGTVTRSFNGLYLQGANIPTTSKTSIVKYTFNDVFNHNGVYVIIANGYIS